MMTDNVVSGALMAIKCPDELRELKAWVIWRYEQTPEEKAKGKKPRKVPYYTNGRRRYGVQGTAEDRGNLVTFDQAKRAALKGGYNGIGFVPQPEMGITIIDFDDAILSNGEMLPAVTLAAGMTYCEVSPSGRGVHAFFRGSFPNKKSHANADRFGVEVFCSSGFVTFTGEPTGDCQMLSCENTIAPLSEAMLQILSERFLQDGMTRERPTHSGEAIGYTDEQLQSMLAAIEPGDDDYHSWINVGMALHHETDGDSRGFELWDEWSQRGAKYEDRQALEHRWDGFGRSSATPVTIRSLVRKATQAGASVGGPVASADEFDDIEDTPEEVAQRMARKARFKVVPLADFAAKPPPGWVIKHVMPDAELIVVYGPSGSGKSFIMLDMAFAMARGEPWRGHKTRKMRVAYVCAEGAGGFRKRTQAYAQHHNVDLSQVALGVIETAPNFLQPDDVKAVIQEIQAWGGAQIVFVDTFAKVTPGANENAGEDMGKALDHCRIISQHTGAMVILIHHTGKDVAKGARGWSGIRAAADAEFEVVRDESSGARFLQTTKQKDGDDDGRWGFKLEQILLGLDEDGDEITSCVVLEDQAPAQGRQPKAKRSSPWEDAVWDAYLELAQGGAEVTSYDLVRAAAGRRPDVGNERDRKKNAKRALANMSKGKDARFMLDRGEGPGLPEIVIEVQA